MDKSQTDIRQSSRTHDFVVDYKILTKSEGGRNTLPSQGIRWDFAYQNEEHESTYLFMIWPQFLDTNGEIIPKSSGAVPISGKARMWIANEKMREYHRDKIYVGMEANAMEGPKIVAKYVVAELNGLAPIYAK